MKFLRRQRIRDSWVVRDLMSSRNKLGNRLTYARVPNIAKIERELSGTENGELWENARMLGTAVDLERRRNHATNYPVRERSYCVPEARQ